MKTINTLLLTIWLILPLAAYERNDTEDEIQILDDQGNVVAAYGPFVDARLQDPLPDIAYIRYFEVGDDWWSINTLQPGRSPRVRREITRLQSAGDIQG